ncbi:MAG TPA: 2'-deoxycytidine 5'-triphosphate deaminase [Stellaceae bacterium]|nr:2'-deoxycytidine 5'-triphosphate deaminase [Stellaceae bacterium]
MTEPDQEELFPVPKAFDADRQRDPTTGLLPSQMLREAVAQGREIMSPHPISDNQIQPASIDLRLGEVAYRVRASFLPGTRASVRDKLDLLSMHRIDLAQGAVLEKDCVYIVPLFEYVALRSRTSGFANPKSSIGRLDVFARVITDHGSEFDRIREGYKGPLYAEIAPRSFSILVRAGSSLVQLRIRRGSPSFSDTALRRLHQEVGLVEPAPGAAPLFKPGAGSGGADGTSPGTLSAREAIRDGLAFTVDIAGDTEGGIVGYKARRHTDLIDVDRVHHYDPREFWEPVYALRGHAGPGGIVLDPHDFYILASREAVVVPADHAAEMLPYHTFVGEFRVHFAGFFDPGFGTAETGGTGSRAVLEVRSHEVPFLIEDGQILGRLVYERLIARPDKLYGRGIGSSYQSQGLALSKHFKKFPRR